MMSGRDGCGGLGGHSKSAAKFGMKLGIAAGWRYDMAAWR